MVPDDSTINKAVKWGIEASIFLGQKGRGIIINNENDFMKQT
jgi:hypothetical protein